MFAYYDGDADIAWFPTGKSDDVVSERAPGVREYDRTTHRLVAIRGMGREHAPSPDAARSASLAYGASGRSRLGSIEREDAAPLIGPVRLRTACESDAGGSAALEC
jgi:hypothetical protein